MSPFYVEGDLTGTPGSFSPSVRRRRGSQVGRAVLRQDVPVLRYAPRVIRTKPAQKLTPFSGMVPDVLARLHLAALPNASLAGLAIKGAFCRRLRDYFLLRGYGDRLIWWDFGDYFKGITLVVNWLQENGLPRSVQVKKLRQNLRIGTNQASFDVTQQLARGLSLGLHISMAMKLSLTEALYALYPGHPLRTQALQHITDPVVRAELNYFNSLEEYEQNRLLQSSIARLFELAGDEILRACISSQGPGLDTTEVIKKHQIFLANMEQQNPLAADNAVTMLRQALDGLTQSALNLRGEYGHLYILADELPLYQSPTLPLILDQLLEPKCHLIFTAHHPSQFKSEDSALEDSITNSVDTHICFRMKNVEIAKEFAGLFFFQEFDPLKKKHSRVTTEAIPIDEKVMVKSWAKAHQEGMSRPKSKAIAKGDGGSDNWGKVFTLGLADAEGTQKAIIRTYTDIDSKFRGNNQMDSAGSSTALVADGEGNLIPMETPYGGSGSGSSAGSQRGTADSDGTVKGTNKLSTLTKSLARHDLHAENWNDTVTETEGEVPTESDTETEGLQEQYITRHKLSKAEVDIQFENEDEFLTVKAQDIMNLEDQTCFIKMGKNRAVRFRTIHLPAPVISDDLREEIMRKEVYTKPCYARVEDVTEELKVRGESYRDKGNSGPRGRK